MKNFDEKNRIEKGEHTMEKDFNKENYLMRFMTVCPICGSRYIDIYDDEADLYYYFVKWKCQDCNNRWTNVYELKSTMYYTDKEGKHIDIHYTDDDKSKMEM